MMQTDYEFYEESYGGTLVPQEAFSRVLYQAEVLLASMVRKQEALREHTEKVAHLLCNLCDLLYRREGRDGLLRESLDGYDVTYENMRDHREFVHLVRQYLGSDSALYRGR